MKEQNKILLSSKKVLFSSLLGLSLLATTSSASSNDYKMNFDINLGYINFQPDNAGEHDGGVFGLETSIQRKVFTDDLYLGGGVAIDWFLAKEIEDEEADDTLGVIADFYATVGYEITSKLSINAIGGYSYGAYGSNQTLDGILYGASIDYKLTDHFGLGLKWKANKFDDIFDTNVDSNRYLLSLSFKF
jgi:hypothetical protein